MKIVKKGLLVLLSLTFIGGAMFNTVGCKGNDNNSSASSSNASHDIASSPEDVEENIEGLSIPELVAQQAHEEKPGYKFCGYFEDENLTKRVKKTFTEIPEGYYAKYQPDKTKMAEYTKTEDGCLYTPMIFEQTIYGETLQEVREKYLQMVNYHCDIRNNAVSAKTTYEWIYGNQFDAIDMRLNDVPKNQILEFEDKCAFPIPVMAEDGMSVKRVFLHYDIKWNAYFGEAQTTEDGIRYYIAEDKYAVVVGFDGEKTPEVLAIPTSLGGKPVQEVSVLINTYGIPWTIRELTVPSSVKNAMIYHLPVYESAFTLEKLIFEEGVQTIRVASYQTEEINIPSTAYFVDLARPSTEYLHFRHFFPADQKITVNGGEHYYTENGLLYSMEGDLVHQFGNRNKLSLQLNDKVKRVIRGSINGIARIIHIPKNVEYIDLQFNNTARRYWMARIAPPLDYYSIAPIFIVNSEKVLGRWLSEYQYKHDEDMLYGDRWILKAYGYIVKGKDVNLQNVLNTYGAFLDEGQKMAYLSYFDKEERVEGDKKVAEYANMMMRIVDDNEIYLAYRDHLDSSIIRWLEIPSAYLKNDEIKEELVETDVLIRDLFEYYKEYGS